MLSGLTDMPVCHDTVIRVLSLCQPPYSPYIVSKLADFNKYRVYMDKSPPDEFDYCCPIRYRPRVRKLNRVSLPGCARNHTIEQFVDG